MKSAHLKVIFLILAALVAVYGVARWVSGEGAATEDGRIPDAVKAGVELIRVLGPGGRGAGEAARRLLRDK